MRNEVWVKFLAVSRCNRLGSRPTKKKRQIMSEFTLLTHDIKSFLVSSSGGKASVPVTLTLELASIGGEDSVSRQC